MDIAGQFLFMDRDWFNFITYYTDMLSSNRSVGRALAPPGQGGSSASPRDGKAGELHRVGM